MRHFRFLDRRMLIQRLRFDRVPERSKESPARRPGLLSIVLSVVLWLVNR